MRDRLGICKPRQETEQAPEGLPKPSGLGLSRCGDLLDVRRPEEIIISCTAPARFE